MDKLTDEFIEFESRDEDQLLTSWSCDQHTKFRLLEWFDQGKAPGQSI